MDELASVDGVVGPAGAMTIPVTDEGLLRGDGVFEVARLYAGRPFAWDEHIARLRRLAANLHLEFDLDAALAEVRATGAGEALLVTPDGTVLEGSTSAFFYALDGHLHTPQLSDHVLDSITRRHVVAVSGTTERSLTRDELGRLDEAFLASTTREVQPVSAIDGRDLPAAPGPLTAAAADAFRRYVLSATAPAGRRSG